MPVQPMKAIGAVAAAQAQAAQGVALSAGMVHGAGLVTGLLWLLLGATGAAQRIARWVGAAVVRGLVLGLALALLLQAGRLMRGEPTLALAALAVLAPAVWPAIWPARPLRGLGAAGLLAALLLGLGWTALHDPAAYAALAAVRPALRLPSFAWPALSAQDLLSATLLLALPQLPLTLGNALVAVHAETRRLFPRHEVGEREVALSTGAMNVVGSAIGGVPMCHGAGGLAAHVAFGARTGGSVVILGLLLLALGLCFAQAVTTLFGLLPPQVLGAVLAATALQLGAAQLHGGAQPLTQAERALLAATAALSVWHVGAGLAVGIVLQQALRARSRRVTR
jgi:MFS superfamily sulfate permease-like transporter